MKAFLLAAGVGSRLRPLTDKVPKCLVPISGKPLLHYWFDLFEKHGISDVLINTHYLADQVKAFVEHSSYTTSTTLFHEETLLGSAGTLRACRDFVENEDVFLICYADNLTNIDLSKMITAHQAENPILTLGLFRTPSPTQCGIVELNDSRIVIGFEEKPMAPKSDLANAGLSVATPDIFQFIPDKNPSDFGNDVLPKLVGRMKGYYISDYFIDIGTIENYEKAEREWQY